MTSGPYHEGERSVQRRVGVQGAADGLAPGIKPRLSRGAGMFLATVRVIVLGAADEDGRCWATSLSGPPGFVSSSPESVRISASPPAGDPLAAPLPGTAVGMLALDLRIARRYRVNGRVLTSGPHGFEVAVEQAYGNCASHIRRQDIGDQTPAARAVSRWSASLEPGDAAHIRRSDRVFVATRHPGLGADVSHKGGPAGFVEVISPDRLRFRDLPGNNMFNTLGNLVVDPAIGLLFHDFDRHTSLQVSGIARVDLDGPERVVEIAVRDVIEQGRRSY